MPGGVLAAARVWASVRAERAAYMRTAAVRRMSVELRAHYEAAGMSAASGSGITQLMRRTSLQRPAHPVAARRTV
jgi:hypothetical protein